MKNQVRGLFPFNCSNGNVSFVSGVELILVKLQPFFYVDIGLCLWTRGCGLMVNDVGLRIGRS